MIPAAASRCSLYPVSSEFICRPTFGLVTGQFLLFQRVSIQIHDFQARIMGWKIAERHPKLSVSIESQTNLFFFFRRNKLPLRRSRIVKCLCQNFKCRCSSHLLIAPCAFPLGFISPRISNTNHGNLSRHSRGADIHHFDACNTVSVSFDQPHRSFSFQLIGIRLHNYMMKCCIK